MRRFVLVLVLGLPVAILGPVLENAAVGPDGPLASVAVAPPTSSLPAAVDPAALPLEGNRILAFYGKPGAKSMGILGEYPKEAVANLLLGYAKLYADALAARAAVSAVPEATAAVSQAASLAGASAGAGGRGAVNPPGVVPAFYIIYGACWPGGDIGYLRDSVVKEWIDYAASQGILVFLDHQVGRFGVDEAMKRLLPWLVYPNVQLALDPEWRTESPMREIGSISAGELNQAQAMMSDYLSTEGLMGDRILVVHQFTDKMIVDRGQVRADWPGVTLIHTSDGFGSPSLKRSAYAWNAKATNMPLKGLKLFFKSQVPGAGYDDPLLTPAQVLDLIPTPELVIYQ